MEGQEESGRRENRGCEGCDFIEERYLPGFDESGVSETGTTRWRRFLRRDLEKYHRGSTVNLVKFTVEESLRKVLVRQRGGGGRWEVVMSRRVVVPKQ